MDITALRRSRFFHSSRWPSSRSGQAMPLRLTTPSLKPKTWLQSPSASLHHCPDSRGLHPPPLSISVLGPPTFQTNDVLFSQTSPISINRCIGFRRPQSTSPHGLEISTPPSTFSVLPPLLLPPFPDGRLLLYWPIKINFPR